MIRVLTGNLFESEAQTLVNPVNCVGAMGKGLALAFRRRYPEMYADYVARCAQKQVRLGEPYLYKRETLPHVLNFPTKAHWRSPSRLEDIVAGLEELRRRYREWGIASLGVPALGCGLGQLTWEVAGPELFRHLNQLEIPVDLYAPPGTAPAAMEPSFLEGN